MAHYDAAIFEIKKDESISLQLTFPLPRSNNMNVDHFSDGALTVTPRATTVFVTYCSQNQ